MKVSTTNKMTDEQKLEMIELYKTGQYSCPNLGKIYDTSGSNILSMLVRRNIPRFQTQKENRFQQIYSVNEKFFEKVDTEEKAYILGMMMGDGHNSQKYGRISISLQECDADILVKINKAMGSNRPLTYCNIKEKKPSRQNIYSLYITCRKLSDDLVSLGCHQRKSYDLKFPSEKIIPIHLLHHFVRGLWDSDGHIGCYYPNNKEYMSPRLQVSLTGTLEICEGIHKIMDEFGMRSVTRARFPERNNNNRTISMSGRLKCIKFLDWLYKDATIYMERKYKKYLQGKNVKTNWHKGRGIERPHDFKPRHKRTKKYTESNPQQG